MDKEAKAVFEMYDRAITQFDADWEKFSSMCKEAFSPMPPPQGGMLGGGGGQGGAPPVDPNTGMPIDPNTGQPIDPNAMPPGGAPPAGAPPAGAPPMDPAAAGGAPPMDPAAAGGAPPQQGGGALPPELEGMLSQLASGTEAMGQAVTEQQATIDQHGERMLKLEQELDELHKQLKGPAPYEGGGKGKLVDKPAAPLELPGDEAAVQLALAEEEAKAKQEEQA